MTIIEYVKDSLHKMKKTVNIAPLIFPSIIVILVISLANSKLAITKFINSLFDGKYFLKEVMDQGDNFWILLLNVIVIVGLVIYRRSSLFQFFKAKTPTRSSLITLTVLAVLSTLFIHENIVERHRVQSDESIYLAVAQNMYHNQKAGACKEGYFNKDGDLNCTVTVTNFKAKGLGLLYMLPMKLFGENLEWIFKMQLMFYFLTFFAAFYAVYSWTNNEMLSLLTATILGMTPTLMFQFRSSSVEPLYVLLSLSALFLMKWVFEHHKDHWDWMLFASFLGFFAQTRQETVFCLFAFGAFSLPYLLDNKKSFHSFTGLLTLFSLPILITISVYQGYSFQGGEHSAHGHFFENVWINLQLMVNTPMSGDLLQNPFLSYQTVIAILGLALLIFLAIKQERYRKWLLFFALYHVQSFMIFENVSGDFTININQRYILIVLPTMAFLGAFFIYHVTAVFAKRFLTGTNEGITPSQSMVLGLIIIALVVSLTYRHKPSFNKDIMYSRNHLTTEQDELRGWMKKNPGRKLFIYGRPYHMIGYGHSSLHYQDFKKMGSRKQKELMQEFEGEVYYVRGLDCWDSKTYHQKAVETRIEAVCDGFERLYDLEELFRSQKVRSYPLFVSKLHGKRMMELEKDLSIQSLNVSGSSVDVQFELKNQGKAHSFDLWFNDKKIKTMQAAVGKTAVTADIGEKAIGYYLFEVRVYSSTGRVLGSVVRTGYIEDPSVTPLVTIQPSYNKQSWATSKVNKSQDGNPLKVNGKEFEAGFGVHSYSKIDFPLRGNYSRFVTRYGVDDEEPGGDGVVFKIFGDDKLLFNSSVMQNFMLKSIAIDVSGIQTLSLQVDSLENKHYDHADWIQPYLLK